MSNIDNKTYKICNVLGGLDVTRVVSSNARHFFQGAIDDVELIREYVSQAATNGGIVGGFSDFKAMNESLQWKARGLEKGMTTVDANLGYTDDRSDRVIERYVALGLEIPFVGDKQTDMKILDTVSNLFPWLVDRRSIEKNWYRPHQNGRSEGPDKEPFIFESLYAAAWIGSNGSAWAYYPPMIVFGDGHPLTFGDVLGPEFEARDQPYVQPNLPGNNPTRRAFLRDPYPDSAQPGLSLITALAPVYFTGTFGNYTYNDTYIASTGVDIPVASTSSLLDILLDTMTASSFAIIADINFNVIVLSQTVVERLYPPRTGFEEERVTYSDVDGSVVDDRRNQTYLVSDTIHEGLTKLTNANWNALLQDVRLLRPGGRSYSKFNLTLRGEEQPVEYYVMYDRWATVAEWVLLAFAPINDVEFAIDVGVFSLDSDQNETSMELVGEWGNALVGEAVLINKGALDVTVTTKAIPTWFSLLPADLYQVALASGNTLPLQFNVDTSELEIGVSSFLLTFTINDDDYSDCFYNHDISLTVSVKVTPRDCAVSTGDPMRVADANGGCVCSSSSVEIGGRCTQYAVLLSAILVPLFILALVGVYMYVEHKRKQADSVWLIKTSELQFDDPPEILGRGTFGLVVRAEYRGTQVAVKRVIPPRTQNKDASHDVIMVGSLGAKMEQNQRIPRSMDKDNHFNFNKDVCGSRESAVDIVSKRGLGSKTESKRNKQKSLDKDHYFNFNKDPSDSEIRQITSLTLQRISNSSYEHNGKTSTLERNPSKGVKIKTYNQLKADFIHEMRLLSKLRHPCITTVMGAVISQREEPLLVMELMDHGSLFDLLHNETMIVEGDLVLQILRDIAQGLRFLHAAKPQVIHGDLKAQNVLVDSKFRAKVADFGLSQKKGTGASGTIFWMAPELLRGESTNTAASDVYSFGIILHEVYSRRIPYDEDVESEHEIVRQICDQRINKRPSIPRSMPPEVVTLMLACTSANPRVRPTFRDIDDDLKSFNVGNVEPGKMIFSMQNKKSWDTTLTATENLLLEIFPQRVAEALSQGQKVEPEHFDCVTIFFSDIVGFTTIAGEMTPMKVSDMLDRLYMKFDRLSRTHDVFKVETIGDAWMGVTNLATPQPDHTKRIADFAMDAIRAASITMIDQEDASKGFVNIRVGFHSGPVIANVVGSRNPKYTLIGDTVNTSSRMESSSLPGRILCSQRAAQLLGEQAPEYTLTSRGFIEVKGKGIVETFWVTSDAQQEQGVRKARPKPRNKLSDCLDVGF